MGEIVLVRHGQASFGADDYDVLSELGWEQSRQLGGHMGDLQEQFTHVFRGDMRRHRETLEGIEQTFSTTELPPATVDAGLNEYDSADLVTAYRNQYGDDPLMRTLLENPGNKKAHFRLLRNALNRWQSDELTDLIETWSDFSNRVRRALAEISAAAGSGQRVLVVASGGSISRLLCIALNLPTHMAIDLNLQIYNTSLHRLFVGRERISLASFNEIPHLSKPGLEHLATYG